MTIPSFHTSESWHFCCFCIYFNQAFSTYSIKIGYRLIPCEFTPAKVLFVYTLANNLVFLQQIFISQIACKVYPTCAWPQFVWIFLSFFYRQLAKVYFSMIKFSKYLVAEAIILARLLAFSS